MTVTLTPIGGTPFTLDPDVQVIVAGYTGRDETEVRHHIDELAAIGVAPPPKVPMVYPMPTELLTTSETLTVTGDNTSGEIEPVFVRHGGKWFLGVGSDHTDRTLETVDIGESKQACPKPIGSRVTAVTDWAAFDYDACQATCTVDDAIYQKGCLTGLRRPDDLLKILIDRDDDLAAGDLVVYGGTLPLIDGAFVPGVDWTLSITLPDGTELTHSYTVTVES